MGKGIEKKRVFAAQHAYMTILHKMRAMTSLSELGQLHRFPVLLRFLVMAKNFPIYQCRENRGKGQSTTQVSTITGKHPPSHASYCQIAGIV